MTKTMAVPRPRLHPLKYGDPIPRTEEIRVLVYDMRERVTEDGRRECVEMRRPSEG